MHRSYFIATAYVRSKLNSVKKFDIDAINIFLEFVFDIPFPSF